MSVAREAFILNGYGATSINSIAKSARVSKNTLYARFPSKAAMFQTIIARQIADVHDELEPATQAPSLPEALRAYTDVALRTSLNKEELAINRLIMAEAYQFPELGETALGRFKVGLQSVTRIIEVFAGRDRIPCRNPRAAAEVFLYSMYGWYTLAIATNRNVTDKEYKSWIDNVIRVFVASRNEW